MIKTVHPGMDDKVTVTSTVAQRRESRVATASAVAAGVAASASEADARNAASAARTAVLFIIFLVLGLVAPPSRAHVGAKESRDMGNNTIPHFGKSSEKLSFGTKTNYPIRQKDGILGS